MAERMIKHKVFFIWDWEAEEIWLNRMAKQGWNLTKVGFCRYEFVKGEPGQYQYRLQALEKWPNTPESQEYIDFVESTGAELVDTLLYWAYFRQSTEIGEFQIFSDTDSRVKHMKRIQAVMIALLPLLTANLINIFLTLFRFHDAWPMLLILPLYLILTSMVIFGVVRMYKKIRMLEADRNLRQ